MSRAPTHSTPRPWPHRLRRREASEYLAAVHGIRLGAGTLAKLASMGGGPRYRLDGRYPLYEPPELDAFAVARLGPLRTSIRDRRAGEGHHAL